MQFGQRHGTERTSGNPTIETLWSLALGLGVAFSDLLEDRRETTTWSRHAAGRIPARLTGQH